MPPGMTSIRVASSNLASGGAYTHHTLIFQTSESSVPCTNAAIDTVHLRRIPARQVRQLRSCRREPAHEP